VEGFLGLAGRTLFISVPGISKTCVPQGVGSCLDVHGRGSPFVCGCTVPPVSSDSFLSPISHVSDLCFPQVQSLMGSYMRPLSFAYDL